MNLRGKKIGVTGATGMVGRYLMRALKARGAEPIGVVRSPNKPPSLVEMGYATRQADLHDPEALRRAFSGLDAVIANAALIAIGNHQPKVVLENNIRRNAQRLRSSDRRCRRHAGGDDFFGGRLPRPRKSQRIGKNALDRRTHASLQLLRHFEVGSGRRGARHFGFARHRPVDRAPTPNLRRVLDQNGFTAWMRRLMAPSFVSLWVNRIGIFPSVYAGDLAEAMCLMLENDAAIGESFNICGEPGRDSYWDHLKAWRAAGLKARRSGFCQSRFRSSVNFPSTRRRTCSGWSPRPLAEGFADLSVAFEREVRELAQPSHAN